MVDWHILTDNNPNENLAEAIAFFNQMAKEYANVPSVYTFEILDFGENKDEYIQMLYDRTPTLPQRLRLGDGYIRNFWKNFGNRIAVK